MNILAIETATDICSVAFCVDGITRAIKEDSIPRKHAEILPLFFQDVKKTGNFKLADLDGIAVSIGPGSFTGLRIGLSYSKGLAFSQGLPLIPVPTLLAMAENAANKSESANVLLFSHRDILFHQTVNNSNDFPKPINEPSSQTWSDVELELNGSRDDVIQWNCERFLGNQGKTQPSATSVGRLADTHFKGWVNYEPFKLVPEYISPFKIEENK